MNLLEWQPGLGSLTKVLGIFGLIAASACFVTVAGTVVTGSGNTSELDITRLVPDLHDPAEALPGDNLDYILGDSIFGSFMIAHAEYSSISNASGFEGGNRQFCV
jgi:hypothetical protein